MTDPTQPTDPIETTQPMEPAQPTASSLPAEPTPPPQAAAPAQPLVAWEPPAPAVTVTASSAGRYDQPPPFTVGALLTDTFARYGADVLRLLLVSVVASGLSWLTSLVIPVSANPFGPTPGFVDVSGIVGLLTFVAGIVGTSTMLALAEGGRALPFGRAIRRGVERSGWLFLTSILLGLGFIALFLLALIPIALFAVISPVLVIVPFLALFAIFLWASLRFMLALPATVTDNLNALEALKLSWRVTKPTGVWGRELGASFVLGLMAAPAAIGTMLLVLPAMFSAMFSAATQPLLLLVPAVLFSIVTPLTLLLAYSAYRRLVPPLQPSWTAVPGAPTTAPPIPDAAPMPAAAADVAPQPLVAWDAPAATAPSTFGAEPPSADPSSDEMPVASLAPPLATPLAAEPAAPEPPAPGPTFRVPRLGTAGKALLALILAFDVAGIAAIPYGIAELAKLARDGIPGFPGFPGGPTSPGFPGGQGFVFPGQVAFGRSVDLEGCTIEGQLFFATAGSPVEFLAALERGVTPQDEVFLRITRDGQVLQTRPQEPGTYDCLGSEAPEPGLSPGVYTYEVVVNGALAATGSLIVQ